MGKDGGGIAEPIRPSLKFDSSGVGHDPSKEFTSNWWEQAYKKAADKIQVTEDGDEGETHVKTVKKLDKKTIERQKREAKNKLYSQFVQVSIITMSTTDIIPQLRVADGLSSFYKTSI